MKQLHPAADHVAVAYRLEDQVNGHDDREYRSSLRLQQILEAIQDKNLVVYMLRNFGGTHIEPKRFAITEKVVKEAITALE